MTAAFLIGMLGVVRVADCRSDFVLGETVFVWLDEAAVSWLLTEAFLGEADDDDDRPSSFPCKDDDSVVVTKISSLLSASFGFFAM